MNSFRPFFLIICLISLMSSTGLYAQTTYNTVTTGFWSSASTWDANGIPPEPIPGDAIVNINHTVLTDGVTQITNNGTFNVVDNSNNPNFYLRGTTQFINNGDFYANSISFGAALFVESGTRFDNNGNFELSGSTNSAATRLTGGTFNNNGSMTLLRSLMTIQTAGSLFTNGPSASLSIGSQGQFNILFFTDNNVVWQNAGEVMVEGLLYFGADAGIGENLTGGSIELGGTFGGLYVFGTLNNSGTVSTTATNNSIQLFGLLNSASGTINHNNGFITGNGTLIQPAFTNNSKVSVNYNAGLTDVTLNLTGDFIGQGTSYFNLGGEADGQYSQMAITGTADISSEGLYISRYYNPTTNSYYDPPAGAAYTIVTADGGVTGTYSSTSLPYIGSDKEWNVEYGSNTVILRVVSTSADNDNDGVLDVNDNCPYVANPGQEDRDGDGVGDACDNCPDTSNPDQSDGDNDGIGGVCDICYGNNATGDTDNDGVCDDYDPDDDGDFIPDSEDNCPKVANPGQENNDGDAEGDVCDEDDDNDGVLDVNDNCPFTANANQEDFDHDGQGDACDPDVCINGVVNHLTAYVNGLNISSSRKRIINSRLDLAARRFCSGSSTSTVITYLNGVISYVQSQSSIPANNANYIISQVDALIDALNNGIVVCCMPRPAPPAGPGQADAAYYQLEANPNPFREQVAIRFYLPEAGTATLEVFNLNGQRVAALHAGFLDAGQQDYSWDGADDGGSQLSSGIYLIRLRTQEGTLTQKVSLVR